MSSQTRPSTTTSSLTPTRTRADVPDASAEQSSETGRVALSARRRPFRSLARSACVASLITGVLVSGTVQSSAAPSERESLLSAVEASSPRTATLSDLSPLAQAKKVLRCFDVKEVNYCLGLGFVEGAPDYAELQLGRSTTTGAQSTGDLSLGAIVAHRSALPLSARIAEEKREIMEAYAGADKAAQVRALLQAPGPATSLDRETTLAPEGGYLPYARSIMSGFQTRQEKSWWCGPATFQSIDWANDGGKDTQTDWASSDDLGTTSQGTSIWNMVRLTNSKTTWDNAAGTYIVQSVSNWTTEQFFRVHAAHLGDSDPAPIIEHPQLLKQYFPYLARDHAGHFQVGRGYEGNYPTSPLNSSTMKIHIFEVYNEADFSSTGNYTWGPRTVLASSALLAAKANTHENIGI